MGIIKNKLINLQKPQVCLLEHKNTLLLLCCTSSALLARLLACLLARLLSRFLAVQTILMRFNYSSSQCHCCNSNSNSNNGAKRTSWGTLYAEVAKSSTSTSLSLPFMERLVYLFLNVLRKPHQGVDSRQSRVQLEL